MVSWGRRPLESWVFFLFLLPGTGLLALSLYVFWLDPGSRLQRSFALMTFLWGTNFAMRAVLPGNVFAFPGLVRNYVFLVLPFANLYFCFEFFVARRMVAGVFRRAVPWVLLLAALGVCALYASDHSWLGTYDSVTGTNTYGPLAPLVGAQFSSLMVIAILFLVAHLRQQGPPHRSFFVAAAAFSLTPMYFGAFYITQQVSDYLLDDYRGYYRDLFVSIDTIQYTLLPVAGFVMWIFLMQRARNLDNPALLSDMRSYGTLLQVLFGAGLLGGMTLDAPPVRAVWPSSFTMHFFLLAVGWLAFAALLTSLVLRHRIFEIEHHVHLVIRRGVVASIFVAVVFVSVEVAAQRLSDSLSWGVGGIAAGLLLFTLHPLQRFAERVADRSLPRGRPLAKLNDKERREMYLEQATIAWADGSLERKERLLLDTLRARLGISAQDARALEELAFSPPRSSHRGRGRAPS